MVFLLYKDEEGDEEKVDFATYEDKESPTTPASSTSVISTEPTQPKGEFILFR